MCHSTGGIGWLFFVCPWFFLGMVVGVVAPVYRFPGGWVVFFRFVVQQNHRWYGKGHWGPSHG